MKHLTKISLIILSAIITITPSIAFATHVYSHYSTSSNLTDIIFLFINLIDQALIVVVALALLFFLWGLMKFILNADNEEKRKEGKSVMIWGIIALFVMISVWGIVGILVNTFF